MDINKKNRSDLKSYFVKNSIPTESNFADLIDATLNQKDDGIVKLPGDPLTIEAAGDVAGLLKIINFYAKFQDNNPAWSLQLNPRTDPNTAATAKAGFAVVDGSGAARLFIDKASGNLGIGTLSPQAGLAVVGTANVSDGNGWANVNGKMAKGSLTVGSITASYGGGSNWSANTAGLLLETLAKTEIAVHDANNRLSSLMYYEGDATNRITIGRDMGWGITPVTTAGNLTVNGGVGNIDSKMQSVGQLVIKGGSPQIDFVDTDNNDWAIHVNSNRMHFIREPWNVDNLVLFGNGNVAIGPGSGEPTEKLEVNGRIKAGALTVGPWPVDPRYVFFGANTLDHTIAANYALLQSVSGNDTGETYLNSSKAIHLRIANVEKMAINSGSSIIYNNLGIGATTPIAKLDIAQAARSGAQPAAVKGLYITGDFGPDADGIEFRHSNATQGIGFGYNTIYAAGSNADQDLQLKPKGKGVVRVLGAANISNGTGVANGSNFMSSGSLTIGATNVSYGGGKSWSTNTAGLLLETLANTEIAVHDSNNRVSSLMYYEGDAANRITIGRDMGWGITPLNIAGNITLNGSVALGCFTDADTDEWPKVTWYRDTANNWDEGLIKHDSKKGFFGRTGFGIHLHSSRDWTFFSTGWNPLLGIEGGTGNTKIKGILTIGDQTVASSMSGAGLLALKGSSPQIDFIDSDHNDWSIHVNSNKMYFIRQPWSYTDLVLDGAGHVGIGTDNPTQAKLVVLGSATLPLNGYGYLNRGGASATNTTYTSPYSIFADQRIAASEFNAHSDARIKNVQSRSDSAMDLQMLLGIEITDYRYKDVIGKADGTHKKVIAQQVEQVFPQAVTKHTDVIPDIYQQASFVDGWVELAADLKQGERVRLISDKIEGVYEVLEVDEDKFRTDFKPEGDAVFVFGREVNDFGNVDYDAIAMLNVSATQQIKKEMDVLKAENAALNARLEALEAKVH